MWCIPPKQDAAFVCAMEQVLEVYRRPTEPDYPVVCMDETHRQHIGEVHEVPACGNYRNNRKSKIHCTLPLTMYENSQNLFPNS